MKRIHILCEGPTEELFVKKILSPYFEAQQIYLYPTILSTRRTASGKKYRGGVSTYAKIKNEVVKLCVDTDAKVTTMLDYYGLPENTPGWKDRRGVLYNDVKRIEAAAQEDIGAANCRFNLIVHEFEGLLFSSPECFSNLADESVIEALSQIVNQFENPEHINNSIDTAPSKRILALLPKYKKTVDGIDVALEIGIDQMVNACPHFAEWIRWIQEV